MTITWFSRGTILFLLLVIVCGCGCWGRKFFRMPRETIETAAGVDSLLRENERLQRRVYRLEKTLKEQVDYTRRYNAQLKIDLEEMKDQINALQQTLRDVGLVSPYTGGGERAFAGDSLEADNSLWHAGTAGETDEVLAADSLPVTGVPGGTVTRGTSYSPEDTLGSAAGEADMKADSILARMAEAVPPPEEIQRQIYLDFSRGAYQLAIEESEIFLKNYPEHPLGEEVRFIRGECFIEQGKFFDSIKEFSIILQKYPHGRKKPTALLRLAVSYNGIGEIGMASDIARRLIKEHPYSEEAAAAEERFRDILSE
jgi:TolA-binding protein